MVTVTAVAATVGRRTETDRGKNERALLVHTGNVNYSKKSFLYSPSFPYRLSQLQQQGTSDRSRRETGIPNKRYKSDLNDRRTIRGRGVSLFEREHGLTYFSFYCQSRGAGRIRNTALKFCRLDALQMTSHAPPSTPSSIIFFLTRNWEEKAKQKRT